MSLDFHITKGGSGPQIDSNGIYCRLEDAVHQLLYTRLGAEASGYPVLERFSDCSKDAFVGHESMELLISEIEHATMLFDFDSPVKQFFGPFHSLCFLAMVREGGISAHAD